MLFRSARLSGTDDGDDDQSTRAASVAGALSISRCGGSGGSGGSGGGSTGVGTAGSATSEPGTAVDTPTEIAPQPPEMTFQLDEGGSPSEPLPTVEGRPGPDPTPAPVPADLTLEQCRDLVAKVQANGGNNVGGRSEERRVGKECRL